MGRIAVGAVKDIVIAVRVSRHVAMQIERRRGPLSKSEWIRAVVLKELGR